MQCIRNYKNLYKQKDLAKPSGYQNQYAWEPSFPLLHFPTLGQNKKSNSNADLLLPEITIHLQKVRHSKFTPKRKIFLLLCMGRKSVKYSESITKSNSHPIPSITQEDVTQQLLTSSFKTAAQDDSYLCKSSVVFIILMGMLEKSAKWLTGE